MDSEEGSYVRLVSLESRLEINEERERQREIE